MREAPNATLLTTEVTLNNSTWTKLVNTNVKTLSGTISTSACAALLYMVVQNVIFTCHFT